MAHSIEVGSRERHQVQQMRPMEYFIMFLIIATMIIGANLWLGIFP
ncbi:MAG: hypothetical protein ACJ703_04925 [Nitrososphaera sp.]